MATLESCPFGLCRSGDKIIWIMGQLSTSYVHNNILLHFPVVFMVEDCRKWNVKSSIPVLNELKECLFDLISQFSKSAQYYISLISNGCSLFSVRTPIFGWNPNIFSSPLWKFLEDNKSFFILWNCICIQ